MDGRPANGAGRRLATTGKSTRAGAPAGAAPAALAVAKTRGSPPQARTWRAAASARSGVGETITTGDPARARASLATALLEREGCTVDRVKSGPEAVEAATTGAHDLILLDLRMPGMGGIEAARALRRQGVTTPIAALTADAFEDSRRACLQAGMDEFLTKPLEPAALHGLLGRVLRPGFTDKRPDAKLAS